MATVIGAIVSIVAGLGLAAGGSFALVSTSDPDSTPQLQEKVKENYNPLNSPDSIIYGRR